MFCNFILKKLKFKFVNWDKSCETSSFMLFDLSSLFLSFSSFSSIQIDLDVPKCLYSAFYEIKINFVVLNNIPLIGMGKIEMSEI